jgi:histidinol-phosphate/aromatic aminotransferase/cobyric acid decarboxylase-like protein
MTVTYAEKLSRMPGYQAGVPTGQAPEAIAAGRIAQLASNESPRPPHPKVVEAIARAATSMNRYPDPDATLLRHRLADRSRSATAPATCCSPPPRRSASRATRSSTPGRASRCTRTCRR